MASPFRPALQLRGQYAEYHRDRRNIATPFGGVPLMMFGSLVLLSRPGFELGGLALSALAQAVPGPAWWAWGLGSFALGWVIQFVVHDDEGRKPAFVDDLVGLFVAPMFVLLELLAPAGFFKRLMAEVERQAGPSLLRDLAHPATR